MLREFAARAPHGHSHRVALRFLRSPVEILGEGEDGRGHRHARRAQPHRARRRRPPARGPDRRARRSSSAGSCCARSATAAGRCAGIPFDERRGLIRNDGGRVCGDDGAPIAGEYCVGWIKRGPTGVIGTNKKDAADTVARDARGRRGGRLPEPGRARRPTRPRSGCAAPPGVVEWDGWQAIDEHERGLGEPAGRPRVKLVRAGQLRDAAAGASVVGSPDA